jgi:serine/threonine-protein kinase
MIGQRLSHYQIVEKLGEGGMGTVYRARDLHLDRPVAIKVLRADAVRDPERQKRFVREAKAASALNHPNIVTIYDIDQADGVAFIAMEYVEGQALDALIRRGRLELEKALHYAVQIADALAKAHSTGIIHRDLKPSNLMVTEAELVKVLDFGLAKLVEPAGSGEQDKTASAEVSEGLKTEEGIILGTVAYMAPEQALGQAVDARSDIFSFGSVLYEMVTGRRAFSGQTRLSTLTAILWDQPRAASDLVREIPAELERILARCLEKDPNRRFPHMLDVKQRLEEVRAGGKGAGRGQEAIASIAVLPFADMSPQKDQEYFCDGIAEELINALSKVEGLRVASRTSSFQFKGRAEDIREIGAKLNARLILEGSVRRAGERLRVAAQLISVADGYHLWSERYDREMKDIFAVQDDISQAVVSTLKIKLLGKVAGHLVKRSTEDLEAYDLYLRGRSYWSKWHSEGMRKAVDFFERAIARDPTFAAAHAGLGYAYAMLGYWTMSPTEVLKKAKAAALKALEIDETLAEAHLSLGWILDFCDWDWSGAERELKRALELNPASADAHNAYGVLLSATGRPREALLENKKAYELDPLSVNVNGSLGCTLYFRREYDQAIEQFQKTLELEPGHPRAYYYLGRAYIAKSMFEPAVTALQQGGDCSGRDLRILGVLGHAYVLMGKRSEAERLRDELKLVPPKPGYPSFSLFSRALVHIGLGEKEPALQCLEQLYQERSTLLHWLKVDPLFDPLRPDGRFADLLRGMGLLA